jgi:hypothetical protein
LGRERARGNSTEATKSHLSLNNNNNNTEKAIENQVNIQQEIKSTQNATSWMDSAVIYSFFRQLSQRVASLLYPGNGLRSLVD